MGSLNAGVGEGMEGVEQLRGDKGAGTPMDVSQRSVTPQVGAGTRENVRDGAAPSWRGSVSRASAMALKSMPWDGVCSASTSMRESESAAVLVVPLMYLMSEVNWAMNSRCLSLRGERLRD